MSDPKSAGRPKRQGKRHETIGRIIEAAWSLSRSQGLGGWTLKDLGAEVGMRAPSLYEYAGSKNALFDLMFADGYRQLLDRIDDMRSDRPAQDVLREGARLFVAFAAEEPVRFQLLFQHTAPGFVPSSHSMELARQVLDELMRVLAQAGITQAAEVDLWTAMLTGLASQQVSNDPGGDRWVALVDTAVDRFLRIES